MFLTSFASMISFTLFFLVIVKSLGWILKKQFPNLRKYETSIRKIISFNNTLYGILSGVYCISFVLFHQKPQSSDLLIYIYYLSKIYEFLDIVLVIILNHAKKSDEGLSGHFAIHHITTLSLVWACFYAPSSMIMQEDRLLNKKTLLGEIHVAPIVTNTFHHFLMYIHLGGYIKMFGRLLPWSGGLQLVVGVLAVGSQVFEKIVLYGKWNIQAEVYVCVMYVIYFCCHIREVRASAPPKENDSK